MTLGNRIPIKLAVESFLKYRSKQHDIVGLAQGLSQAMSLLEGDIPKPVREAIVTAEAQIDSIRFGVNESREIAEVNKVWRELEEVFSRNGIMPEENGAPPD